ncbi:MAG: ATPase, T2SS/T4P/T4SS family, partial [Candidatus Odinarchaeia archaeon]
MKQTSIGNLIQKIIRHLIKLIKYPRDFNKILVRLNDASILLFEDFIHMIYDIGSILPKIKNYTASIKFKVENCSDSTQCITKYGRLLEEDLNISTASYDPIAYYLQVNLELALLSSKENKNCIRCLKQLINNIKKIKELLEKSKLISKYLTLPNSIKNKSLEIIYEKIIKYEVIPEKKEFCPPLQFKGKKILDIYSCGPYEIEVISTQLYVEPVYRYKLRVNLLLLNKIKSMFKQEISDPSKFPLKIDEYYQIDQLIEIRKKQAETFIDINFPELNSEDRDLIAVYLSIENTALNSIYPYLLDDLIEEIFIDNPYSYIYIDHRKHGRCITDTILELKEFEKIATYLRAVSKLRLDKKNPTLKTELITNAFHVRISIDTPPLAVDEFHMDIRKLRKRYFTLPELIYNKTINSQIAAYLYFCLLRKRNFVIMGRPSDGKTTLLNALDAITPPHWRKITVEDVIESIPQNNLKHQTRLQVDSFDKPDSNYKKSTEITRLLHRSPDYILVSEIQAAEDSRSLFHAISAGLTGLYTCHGNSVEDLLLRWSIHHKIPVVSFYQLDSIIHIKKFDYLGDLYRKIVRISEIQPQIQNIFSTSLYEINIVDVFKWNPVTNKIESKIDLYETPVIKKIREYEAINKTEFYKEIYCYQTLFEMLMKKRIFSYFKVTDFFNK